MIENISNGNGIMENKKNHSYNTRAADNIYVERCRINKAKNGLFWKVATDYNQLLAGIKALPYQVWGGSNVKIFKRKMNWLIF